MYILIVPDAERIPDIISIGVECNLSPWTEKAYLEELQRTDSIVFAVVSELSDTVGFITGRTVPGPLEHRLDAEIYNIGIRPDVRRAGLGKMLLESFTDACTAKGVDSIWLEVRSSNSAAISFYESYGFMHSSIRRKFYKFPEDDAVVMKMTIERTD